MVASATLLYNKIFNNIQTMHHHHKHSIVNNTSSFINRNFQVS